MVILSVGDPMTDFIFRADQLCLDFLNTVVVKNGVEVDLLTNLDDLVDWYREAGDWASEVAVASPESMPRSKTTGVLEEALRFRSKLRDAVRQVITAGSVPLNLADDINSVLSRSPGYQELKCDSGRWYRQFRSDEDSLSSLLAVVANSAAELVNEGDLGLVRQCRGDNCAFYFYDKTKNKSRRWCSMKTCGNRSKAAAHYRRVGTLNIMNL
jgi:predicted RNA-binding Zn ribbon-like protein